MRHLNKETLKDMLIRRTEEDIAAERVGGVVLSVWQDGEEVFSNYFGDTN